MEMGGNDGFGLGAPLGGPALQTRLTADLDTYHGAQSYADLRVATADWIGGGSQPAEDFGRTLVELESLLEQSYLLEQPNVAGMGVGAWGLAVRDPLAAMGKTLGRTRRMVRGGMLGRLFDDEPTEDEEDSDPKALARAADLLDAIDRLDQASQTLPEDAPLHPQVNALRTDLSRRLRRERRHDPAIDRALTNQALSTAEQITALRTRRAAPQPVETIVNPLPSRQESIYQQPLERTIAQEPVDLDALTTLRSQIGKTAQSVKSAAPNSAQARRLVEKARRLLAQEVAMTHGDPTQVITTGPDTMALRRALANQATRTPRPTEGDVRLAKGLPEVPIMSSRGAKARVVGYLRTDEATQALEKAASHTKVPVPGQKAPGWIENRWLHSTPEPTELIYADRSKPGAPAPGLGKLAAIVAGETGRSVSSLVAEAARPELAHDRPALADDSDLDVPISIGTVQVDGLNVDGGDRAADMLNGALSQVTGLLEKRLVNAPKLLAALRQAKNTGGVTVDLNIDVNSRTGGQVTSIAAQIADALINAGSHRVDTLRLRAKIRVGKQSNLETHRQHLLARLATGDVMGISEQLSAERKQLDGTIRHRLASFFGDTFDDVMVFAGPMSGALARSLHAEALTHGKMVFFDEKHFRPDTAQGQALMAHEFAHTRQTDDRDVRQKEAEALAVEANYLDWIRPGGAPLAQNPLDPTAPDAAAAADVSGGIMRAKKGRDTIGSKDAGARADSAQLEERVAQVIEQLKGLIIEQRNRERDRIGDVGDIFSGPI